MSVYQAVRKSEKALKSLQDIENVIQCASICRMALFDGEYPYIVPLCFGYQEGKIYIHSGKKGKKLNIIGKMNKVCIEFDIDTSIVMGETACGATMHYRSVIGFGKAFIVDNFEEKIRALDIIMRQYSNKKYSYPAEKIDVTEIIRVDIDFMTGKISGYP